jgi:hypothetical protein
VPSHSDRDRAFGAQVTVERAEYDDETFELYRRYQTAVHKAGQGGRGLGGGAADSHPAPARGAAANQTATLLYDSSHTVILSRSSHNYASFCYCFLKDHSVFSLANLGFTCSRSFCRRFLFLVRVQDAEDHVTAKAYTRFLVDSPLCSDSDRPALGTFHMKYRCVPYVMMSHPGRFEPTGVIPPCQMERGY